MRVVQMNLVADNADVFSGTSLNQLEGGGQLDIYAISSQADSLMTLTGPDNEPIAQNVELPQQSRAVSISDDPSLSLPVRTGGHFTLAIDIQTAAIVQILAIYRKAGIDF